MSNAAPDPAPVLSLIEAFRRSKVMFAAVELGVFDRLAANGPAAIQALADGVGGKAEPLARLLDTCVALGLLTRDGEGRYANTPAASAYLCSESPRRLTGYISFSNKVLWRMWENLEDAVREGTPRWKQTFQLEGDIFKHFYRTEESMREFLMGMHGFGLISSPLVVAAFDLSRFQHMADLGGATGHLPVAACLRYPNLTATVFDLANVVPMAKEQIALAGLEKRITAVAGDFFSDDFPKADIYALGRILHDWGDEKAARLLRKIYSSLPANGALLIAEKLLDADRCGPAGAQLQSLNMLVVAEGKERTLAEYTALLKAAGFSKVEASRTTGPVDAILASR